MMLASRLATGRPGGAIRWQGARQVLDHGRRRTGRDAGVLAMIDNKETAR